MKRSWADAARSEEVRAAARGWAHAKAIDAPTVSAIEAAYPETRITLHPVWRVLIFLFVSVALSTLFAGIFHGVAGIAGFRWPAAIYAAVLAVATEILRGSRLAGTGADAATSFQCLTFLVIAVALFLTVGNDPPLTLLIAIVGAAAALAAWRWGFWFYALSSAVAGYVLVARMPWARPAWIVLAPLIVFLCHRRLERASIAPPHRRSLAAIFVASAAALYTAVNLYALDFQFVERIRGPWLNRFTATVPLPTVLRVFSALVTAAFPILFLAWGIRTRRRLILGIGIVSAALSVATLRYYRPIGPRWAYLTACGAILIGAALWAHRRLRDSPRGAWRGLTASPLYELDDAGISPLGALGAQIAVTPAAPERPGFTGGGGEFGGGGASGQY